MRPILTLLAVLFALWAAGDAAAHRQPEVETVVERGEGITGTVLKITHRLHAHDAKRVLAIMPDVVDTRLEDPKNQARLALYAKKRFVFEGGGETEIIGVEIDGNYVFLYQEHPVVAALASSTLLADVEPGWTNRVITRDADGTVTSTVVFREGQERAAGR